MSVKPTQPDGRIRWRRGEVVRVASPAFLVDEQRRACRYVGGEAYLLDPGYYLVLWPEREKPREYGAEVRFIGPVASREAAELLRVSALGLGIVAPAPEQSVSEQALPRAHWPSRAEPQLALDFA